MKWRLLLPGASEPRLTAARPPGLQSRCQRPLTRPPQPEHSCHSQLLHWPDDGGTIPSKETPFTPSSILFRPRRSPAAAGFGWRRRVPPPGPMGLFRRSFIAIAGLAAGRANIGRERFLWKGLWKGLPARSASHAVRKGLRPGSAAPARSPCSARRRGRAAAGRNRGIRTAPWRAERSPAGDGGRG
jgi:hypothetical protein